jgi:phosphoserine phosphatase RsbU/P
LNNRKNLLSKKAKSKNPLLQISEQIKNNIFSKSEIIERLYDGLKEAFDFSEINIFLFDTTTFVIDYKYPVDNNWILPVSEKTWLLKRTKELLLNNPDKKPLDYIYLSNRDHSPFIDKNQLKKDQHKSQYSCCDGLYLLLFSEDENLNGVVFINNWDKKQKLKDYNDFSSSLANIRAFIKDIVIALDNWTMHQKIESLLSDKNDLKQKIEKDEEKLKRRILELSVLYDISNSLGSAVDHLQIVTLILDSLYKALQCNISGVFLADFFPDGEIILKLHHNVAATHIETMKSNIISAVIPFLTTFPDIKKLKTTKIENDKRSNNKTKGILRSFANVPLIFKEEVLGVLSICSVSKNAFNRSEITYLHTIANQLAAHLARIKIIKEIEKSKISSLTESMTEGIVMLDSNQCLEIINPQAQKFLAVNRYKNITNKLMLSRLSGLNLSPIDKNDFKHFSPVLNQIINFQDKIFSVNVTPVINYEGVFAGTVFVFRDVTEIQKINRVKTQRLEVISKVSFMLNSITDINNLLAILLEFILNIANADTGSIQLIQKNLFYTKVHANFPDKIRKKLKLKSNEIISDHVIRTKEVCIIRDFMKNPNVEPNPQLSIDSYVCLPLLVKGALIGVVNIIQKSSASATKLTYDDIKTLMTITSLSGTAIHNALLYKETLRRKALEQELKIANSIQNKLLPSSVPNNDTFNFGAISIPAREIGGDYYDFFILDEENIGILLADIIGKGIPAGLFMAMLKSILHRHIPQFISPAKALSYLNKLLFKDQVINKFVPLFYGILNTKNNSFTYSNAGHEPAMLYSKNKVSTLDTMGFPLGAYEDAKYQEKEITLQDEDIVLIFTDGVVEARNKNGIAFGRSKLQSILKQNKNFSADKLVKYIYSQIKNTHKPEEQYDDLTIVSIKADKEQKTTKNKELPLKTKKLKLTSARKNIKVVRETVGLIAKEIGFNDSEIYNIKLAINEAQANIIEHAYFGKEDKEIHFNFIVYEDRLVIGIKDFGKGYKQSSLKAGTKYLNSLEGSGLGVFLIKSIMDDVQYKQIPKVGTEIMLTKYINKEL